MKFIKKIYHFLLAHFAYWYYGRPTKKIKVIGVTGTKGKSTTARLIASVLQAGGFKVGLLTTVEVQIGEHRELNKHKMTMLGRGKIQKLIKEMVKQKCDYVVVETSSEGILQYRHLCLNYDVAVFTNLSSEHVEAHGGFENLKKDKGKLFSALDNKKIIGGKKVEKVIIVNGDDSNAQYYYNFKADKKFCYGLSDECFIENCQKIKAQVEQLNENGSQFIVGEHKFKLNLVGEFNIYNAVSAIAVGKAQNISEEKIAKGLLSVKKVEGRMEFIDEGQDFKVVVDYAHEPVSLEQLFKALRQMLLSTGKIIAIVGSDGGGRDKSKRNKMGEVAGSFADIVIVTDVNCFNEDPSQIAEMLAVGAQQAGKKENTNLFIEIDRRKAITKAFQLAQAGDVVAITAKGTEPCIVVANNKKIPWDDRQVAREILKELKNFD